MSSKKNKKIRMQLEKMYGKGCFFARARLAERLEQIDKDLSFKRFVQKKIYSGKKISHQISLHHLQHQSEGASTTVENGANVEEIAHQFLHSLPRDKEEIANNMLRQWKLNYIPMSGDEGTAISYDIENAVTIDLELGDDFIEIPLLPQTKKQKYNRAKTKREYQRIVDEDLEDWERD